ncbi:SAM-dependent methyltransferase [Nocardia sp. BMG51109]|uniref:SAM-dependent methyltransferase n=1 Tax=Nocardia sp. BMG51109 TaxID=1056816 RepID=UPI00046510EE|nr:SAM-dependent methyltransferase [Nocardia sp. BMG51109]
MSVADNGLPIDLRIDRPHPARMYDWYLNGKDHYEADRIQAAKVEQAFPTVKLAAWINREFMHRATTFLARAGIRQFLDIGTGIPTEWNLHQIAQALAPDSRVVYVDNDPLVLTHARALMNSTPEGRTSYVEADVTTPDDILTAPALLNTLDLSTPVAVSLVALLHFIPDSKHPYDIVTTLMDACPAGSYLVTSHATPDFDAETFAKITEIYQAGGMDAQFRTREEIERLFTGLQLVEPGITTPHRWHADIEVPLPNKRPPEPSHPVDATDLDTQVGFYAGVARKG